MSDMTILEQWRSVAYNQNADKNKLQRFWATYFNIEKNIYEQLLENPDEVVSGTVKELAEKYGQDVMTMVGFLDGITGPDWGHSEVVFNCFPIRCFQHFTSLSVTFHSLLVSSTCFYFFFCGSL